MDPKHQFEWEEWRMESADGNSSIEVPGMPVSVSAAYTGRVAIAYQAGASFHKKVRLFNFFDFMNIYFLIFLSFLFIKDDHASKYVNLCTAIYECESTGGSQWIREDVIHLKNIELQAEMPPMDLSVFNDVRIVKSSI